MSEFQLLMKKLNKEYGQEILTVGFDQSLYNHIEKIPFTSPRANYMSYGGIPRGRLIEFAGEESSGKTTTALDIVGNAQQLFQREYDYAIENYTKIEKLNKTQTEEYTKLLDRGPLKILYIDAENTLDMDWAELLGAQIDKVIFYKPQQQCAEEIFEDIINLINTGEFGLIVLDSLGVLVSKQAYEKTIEERTMAGISAALTTFSKKMNPLCHKFNCTFIGINQVRDNLGSPYGGLVTTGGRAWKHNCSVRIMFRKGYPVDDLGEPIKKSSENPFGNRVEMDILKTKCFKPDRKIGFYTLSYFEGINPVQDLFELALKYEFIAKGGAWYTFMNLETNEPMKDSENELLKFQGKKQVMQVLDENSEIRLVIENKIAELILGIA